MDKLFSAGILARQMIFDATGNTQECWEKLNGHCVTHFACLLQSKWPHLLARFETFWQCFLLGVEID
ncbi:MAG: hypothetical protein AAEI92_03015 [Arenicellales bacterium]